MPLLSKGIEAWVWGVGGSSQRRKEGVPVCDDRGGWRQWPARHHHLLPDVTHSPSATSTDMNTQTVPTGTSHLPNLSHTEPDGVWFREQPGMQNWPFSLKKRGKDEIYLWSTLCLLQLTILKQPCPLILLIIKEIETKRRHRWSPLPTVGEGGLVKLSQKLLLRAKLVQPPGGKFGNISQNLGYGHPLTEQFDFQVLHDENTCNIAQKYR